MDSNQSTCYNLSIAKEVIPAIISFGKLYCPSYLHQTTVPTTILFFSLKEDHKISRRKNKNNNNNNILVHDLEDTYLCMIPKPKGGSTTQTFCSEW